MSVLDSRRILFQEVKWLNMGMKYVRERSCLEVKLESIVPDSRMLTEDTIHGVLKD